MTVEQRIAAAWAERQRLHAEAQALSDQYRGSTMSAADANRFDALLEEVRDIDDRIRDERERDERERNAAGRRAHFDDVVRPAGQTGRGGRSGASSGRGVRALLPSESLASVSRYAAEEEGLDFGLWLRGTTLGNWNGADRERRAAMESGTGSLGGYLVPAPLSTRIIDLARDQTRVVQAGAMTIPMDSGSLDFARVLADPTAAWKVENAAIGESDMTFGKTILVAQTLAALCRISIEAIEDAQNVGDVIEHSLAAALALELDRVALSGTGTPPEPMGVSNTPGVQSLDLGTDGAPVTVAGVSDACQLVWAANGLSKSVIMSTREAGDFDKQQNAASGEYVTRNGPDSWMSLQKLMTNQIPTDLVHGAADNASELFIGDFSQMYIGVRREITVEASRTAADAFEHGQVMVRAYMRADVVLAQPSHFAVIRGIIPTP